MRKVATIANSRDCCHEDAGRDAGATAEKNWLVAILSEVRDLLFPTLQKTEEETFRERPPQNRQAPPESLSIHIKPTNAV